MNEETAFRAIRNAIHLESLSRKTAAKVTPYLREAYRQLQRMIAELPEEAIGRELRYKQLANQIEAILDPASRAAQQEITLALIQEMPTQIEYAEKVLSGEKLTAAELARPVGTTFIPTITRTQLIELATDTKVLGKRIDQLFGEGVFTASQVKHVDKVVKQGFLLGETNDQIARNLAQAFNGSRRDVRAVTRTAVMDMSQRAQNRFWDANSDRIALWEFDATFDYRVCPQCYPYDGKRSADRDKLPQPPVHPNCRCRLLPLTNVELALEKQEMKEGMEMSIVEVNKNPNNASGRVYKTKVRVDGKTMIKSAREVSVPKNQRPTMANFIDKATPDTRRAVLGKVRAQEFEYITSDNRGPRRQNIEDALRHVTNGDAASFAKAQRARARRRK